MPAAAAGVDGARCDGVIIGVYTHTHTQTEYHFTVTFTKDLHRKIELKLPPPLKSVAALPCEI